MTTELISGKDFSYLKQRALNLTVALSQKLPKEQQDIAVDFFEGVRKLSTYKFFHPRTIEELSAFIFEDVQRHEILTEVVLSLSSLFLSECAMDYKIENIIYSVIYGRCAVTSIGKEKDHASFMPKNLRSLVTVEPDFIYTLITANPWILALYFYHLSLLEQS